MLPTLALTLIAFLLSFLGPGFLFVRRWSGSPEEKITASVAISLFLVYGLSFGAFVLSLPRVAHDAILVLCAGMTLAPAREYRGLFESREARSLMGWLGLLALWCLGLMALIRNYSGGTWYGDWLEHYQRSLFFLGGEAPDFKFQGDYLLSARPPLMNVLGAHFLALVDRGYPVYQAISVLLNVLVFLPFALLVRLFSPARRSVLPWVAAALMFNPMWAQNATYAWTKLLAAFYVLFGVYLYLTAVPSRDRTRFLLSFASFAAGTLTHYSAGPYLVFFAVHYALVASRRDRRRWTQVGLVAGCAVLVLAPWFAWSLGTYGLQTTIVSTSSVRDAAARTGTENLAKIVRNIWNTLVPHPFRGVDMRVFDKGVSWGAVRDVSFKIYQQNLPLSFGIAGLPLLLLALIRARSKPGQRDLPGSRFWLAFSLFIVMVGIAVHGGDDPVGLAHICLQPFILIGLAFLVANLQEWSAGLQLLAAAGLLFDFLAGIALHFWFQATPFLPSPAGEGFWHLTRHDLLIGSPLANWQLKTAQALGFVGDDSAIRAPLLLPALGVMLLFALIQLARHPARGARLPEPAPARTSLDRKIRRD